MKPLIPTPTGEIDTSIISKSVKLKDSPGYKIISPLDGIVGNVTSNSIDIVSEVEGTKYKIKFDNVENPTSADKVRQGQTIGYFGSSEIEVTVFKNNSKIDAGNFFSSEIKTKTGGQEKKGKEEVKLKTYTDDELKNFPELKLFSKIGLAPFEFVHSALTNKKGPTNPSRPSKMNEELDRIKKLMNL